MLALRPPRCLLHSLRYTQTRTLRTLPRDIPTYIKRWDPTLHRPIPPSKVLTKLEETREAAPDDASQRVERDVLRDTQTFDSSHREGDLSCQKDTSRLTRLLRLARDDPDVGLNGTFRASLWGAYTLAKASDPKVIGRLSDRARDSLWTTQYLESPANRSCRAHLEQLYLDMKQVGKPMTVGQRAQYLESMFLGGEEEQALEKWEADHNPPTDGGRQDYKPEHLEAGAKLHALAGNVDRARHIMEELYTRYPDWNLSVMMTVFRAHTSSGMEQHHESAKDMYIEMKEKKGANVSINDYNAWFIGFLEARHLPYAKQLFRDMVQDGHLTTLGTAEQVEEVLKRLHMLYRLGTDISNMTSIALDALSVLPEAYHGHLFGDWMKSAVLHKAPEAAAQILDMMFQRGYNPETFHFNMLLKALLRTKENPNILKAENIGWRMIDEARKSTKKNLPSDSKAEFINKRRIHKIVPVPEASRTVPKANVATFALIMHHHAKNLQWEHVDYLSRQLKETTVEPNATIMNVLMDNKCRQGAYAEAWMIYKTLTEPQKGSKGVFPNGASIRCLWKMLRLALGDHITRDDANLPTPRELLEETVTWLVLSRSRYDAERFRTGLAGADHGAITALMMHCFSYVQDLPGSLVALHVLRHKFDIFPTDKAAQILQRQMAWVDMARESESVRSQYSHSRNNKRNNIRIAKVYDTLLNRRLDRMNLSSEEYAALSDEQIGDVGLDLLSEFVRVVLKRSYPPEVVEAMIQAAKNDIGLPELRTGDMDAFEVA
ncbi:uncharacterized protein K460DRAFT_371559 [Cucurbitaria berberidis CBS 394.84]|uniref:Pentatricopeptide repeat protein n=1 Tax=Cucurbitaria berberidis CBS 394.84 TaxID=1168544 RepID=A0A9P4G7J2_9PLEO|nr:uncharacterized protein K460DRAFT_371559 [Cucurbitaria berberidis CBS 394.84]KAF1840372.1 hypothetical protein K460DRAFT_371559 [Cucurbitaria berberidis CBS 394.84]